MPFVCANRLGAITALCTSSQASGRIQAVGGAEEEEVVEETFSMSQRTKVAVDSVLRVLAQMLSLGRIGSNGVGATTTTTTITTTTTTAAPPRSATVEEEHRVPAGFYIINH